MEELRSTDPYELLEQRREAAVASANFEELKRVIEEARHLDGWDESDPRFGHLVERCSEDLKDVMTYFG